MKSSRPCAKRFSRADLVITTGGLGPTSDDLTRELIAELLGKKLIENRTCWRTSKTFLPNAIAAPAENQRGNVCARGRHRFSESKRHRARVWR
jgi:molybdopterin-biosynthesis enzyme MoeA-like protein